MTPRDVADLLWFRAWWIYPQSRDPWFSIPYHFFNLFKGFCWLVVGTYVLGRYLVHRRSPLEIVYGLAFLGFGLTDFREAYRLESWLVWIKLVNLLVLIWLRRIALRRWYPGKSLC